jgi:hypothetical protein
MALTLQDNPGPLFSAHGDLIFTVLDAAKASDPVTYPDYRYVCDVYIGTTQVARLKSYPHPDSMVGIFNVANIVRNYLATTFSPHPTNLEAQVLEETDWWVKTTMKFGEEYSLTLTTNILVDTERTYFNHYNGRLLGQETTLSDYIREVVSLRPLTTPVNDSDNFCLIPFYSIFSSTAMLITSYTKDGVSMGTYAISSGTSFAGQIMNYNFSPGSINAASPGLIVPGVTGYYTVRFGGAFAPTYRFNLTCEAQHEVFTVHFLNRFGGFESRNFTKVSRKTIDIERSDYGKLAYTIDNSGVVSYRNSNNVYNETRTVYASQYKEKMTLNTDNLTDGEYTWLGDLILSPMVYVEMSGYFIPCIISQSDYEFRKHVNDKITNLTMNIEFGDQFNAQYR